jgi:hypothetical protein
MDGVLRWQTGAGVIRLLPGRGRLLGIELGGHEALWAPGESTAPWNLGGERLWIGPERDWFWQQTDKVDFSHYQVPPALNPDHWNVLESTCDHAAAETCLTLQCTHSDRACDLRIHRTWDLLSSEKPEDLAIHLRCTTSLDILGGSHGQPVDLWSLIQIPPGGVITMAANETPCPRDHFDPCPTEDFEVCEGKFRLKIGGQAIFKIGLPPQQASGEIIYSRPVPEGCLELHREFSVHPGLRYCDAPLNAPGSQGDAVQFFNDGGQHGCFGELEHHSPALHCGVGPQSHTEITTTTVHLSKKPAALARMC